MPTTRRRRTTTRRRNPNAKFTAYLRVAQDALQGAMEELAMDTAHSEAKLDAAHATLENALHATYAAAQQLK